MKCFLSYNSSDRHFARKLAVELAAVGIDVWYDEWLIQAGQSITGKIEEGIRACDFFIIVMSPHSVASTWVKEELRAALQMRLSDKPNFIIPVLLADCEIPLFLRDYRFWDFRDRFDVAVTALVRDISYGSFARECITPHQIRHEVVRISQGPYFRSLKNERVIVPYDYLIDRFPVSRRKFYSFIFSGAYFDKRYWHHRALEWMADWFSLLKDNDFEAFLYTRFPEARTAPEKFNFPIRYITAYEAEAYAQWVGGRLPSEDEWEKAARGTDGRIYPWGDELNESFCHTEKGLEFPVDSYPEGCSPFGLFNVAGNKCEFIGELASDEPSDLADEILTRGWLEYWSPDALKNIPRYGIFGQAGCFPVAARSHPITFRCVYPVASPYDRITQQVSEVGLAGLSKNRPVTD